MPIAQAAAEDDLWTRWRVHRDFGAREQLAGIYAGYARIVAATMYARQYRDGVEFADYYQLACVGLMEALDRFDPGFGVQFKTFSAHRMRGAVLDGIECMTEKHQQIVARGRIRAQRLRDLCSDVPGGSARLPSQVLAYVAEVGVGLALAWVLEGTGMMDDGARAETIHFYRSVEIRQLRKRLLELVDALPAQERVVVRGHYLQGRPFEEIASLLDLTRGRISQIHRQAIDRLRASMHPDRGSDVCL